MENNERKSHSEFYPFKMDSLPLKFVRRAETELSEFPEVRDTKVKEVRNLLRLEKVQEEWFSDDDIITFLRYRKYDTKRACSTIKNMVAFVTRFPQFFRPLDPEVLDKIVSSGMNRILPRRDKNGCSFVNGKIGKWNPTEINKDDALNYFVTLLLHSVNEPMSQVNGVRILWDFECSILKYLKYCSPFLLYHLHYMATECIPLRIKELHFLKPNIVTSHVVQVILAFASEKNRKKIRIHRQVSDLLNEMPENIVPVEYGGDLTEEDCSLIGPKEFSTPGYVTAILDSIKTELS